MSGYAYSPFFIKPSRHKTSLPSGRKRAGHVGEDPPIINYPLYVGAPELTNDAMARHPRVTPNAKLRREDFSAGMEAFPLAECRQSSFRTAMADRIPHHHNRLAGLAYSCMDVVAAEVEVNVQDTNYEAPTDISPCLELQPAPQHNTRKSRHAMAGYNYNATLPTVNINAATSWRPSDMGCIMPDGNGQKEGTGLLQHLNEENHQLRVALAQRDSRLAQLESLVLERNLRLKQLLSENVRLSAKLKRMQTEFGIEAVKEAFNKVEG